mgnify:CR=1 FL=1
MREHIIKFTIADNRSNTVAIARVYGNDITLGVIDRVRAAVQNYKNEGKWDTNGCFDSVQEQLEAEGYEVRWINEEMEICL